jgi:hypothetical protein
MELPDDVLTIISAYSKPFLYTHVLKLLGLEKWTTLNEKLLEPYVLPALKAYINAKEMMDDPWIYETKAFCIRNCWRTLTYLLYGKEKAPYQLRTAPEVNVWN